MSSIDPTEQELAEAREKIARHGVDSSSLNAFMSGYLMRVIEVVHSEGEKIRGYHVAMVLAAREAYESQAPRHRLDVPEGVEAPEPAMTRNAIVSIGGKPWKPSHGEHAERVYLAQATLLGLEVVRYKTGNISSATIAGERVSNAKAARILACAVYWEGQTGKLMITGRDLVEYRDRIEAAILERIAKLPACPNDHIRVASDGGTCAECEQPTPGVHRVKIVKDEVDRYGWVCTHRGATERCLEWDGGFTTAAEATEAASKHGVVTSG